MPASEGSLSILQGVAKAGEAILGNALDGPGWNPPLAILGNATKADRCYVFRNHPHPLSALPACSQVAEWVADGIAPQIDFPDLQNILWQEFSPRWQATLSNHAPLFGRIADFPANEQPLLEAQSIKSLLVVPIFCKAVWWGFIGFDDCRHGRTWTPEDVALLQTATTTIGLRLAQQVDAAQLQNAMQAAEKANAAKSRFLATTSHEIRTPLNSIIGYTQLLLASDALPTPQKRQVDTIHRSGQHLLNIINDILDISKIEAGKVHLSASEFSLPAFLDSLVDFLSAEAAFKGIQLQCVFDCAALPPEHDLRVRTDIKALRQVLINLLGNAIKFTKEGSVSLSASIESLSQHPTRVRFAVSDTGIGIPKSAQHEIGNSFFQVEDHSQKGLRQGTGLGLAIVRSLVDLLGGHLEFDSTVGKGSTFWFTIPLHCQAVAHDPTPNNKGTFSAESLLVKVSGYKGPRKHVLIVDDVPDNRALIRDILAPLGFLLSEAANGREAARLVDSNPCDLVLTDIVMPFMDGIELLHFIRTASKAPNLPVIAISASVFHGSATAHSKLKDFDAFLNKPIDTSALLSAIAKCLDLSWSEKTHTPPTAHAPTSKEAIARLQFLHNAAMIGDFAAIRENLPSSLPGNPALRDELTQRLDRFEVNAVLQLIESHLS